MIHDILIHLSFYLKLTITCINDVYKPRASGVHDYYCIRSYILLKLKDPDATMIKLRMEM